MGAAIRSSELYRQARSNGHSLKHKITYAGLYFEEWIYGLLYRFAVPGSSLVDMPRQ